MPKDFSHVIRLSAEANVQVYTNPVRTKSYDGGTKALPYDFWGRLLTPIPYSRPSTPVRRRKKTALRLRKAVHRGIGIRTPTYRVRVCCATVTQYPYLLRFGFVLCRISLTGIIISRSIPFVNTLFKLFQKNLSGIFFPVPPPSVQCRTLQFLHKCGIIW